MISEILKDIIRYIKLIIFKSRWKKNNQHNNTIPVTVFPIDKVDVGYKTYGKLNVSYYGNENEKLIIGRYCCIANDVKFILGGEHHSNFISNYLFKYYLDPNNDIDDRKSKGKIIIKDDVWIGVNSVILSGVTIGQGAVIAAGSVVSKDVPPYAVYTTNKIIKYRFDSKTIEQLLKIDFEQVDYNFVSKNLKLFYSEDIQEVLNNHKIKSLMR